MTKLSEIAFARPGRAPSGTLIVLAGDDLRLGAIARSLGVEIVALDRQRVQPRG